MMIGMASMRFAGAVLAGVLLSAAPGVSVYAAPVNTGADLSITGELLVVVKEDFDSGRSETEYSIRQRNGGRPKRLHFEGSPPAGLRSGMTVSARGRANGNELFLAADSIDPMQPTEAPSVEAATGEQRILVMLGHFSDMPVACTTDQLRDILFSDPVGNHVDALYREMSLGAVSLSGDVTGPFTLDYASTDPVCDTAGWANALDTAATDQGFDITAYTSKVYVLPSDNACGWSGFGSIGGNPGQAWVMRCDVSGVYAHELGHNLGMNHASTPTNQYGDTSDPMGSSVNYLRKINAPHHDQMGWLPAYKVVEVTQSGVYDIAPLGTDPATYQSPQVLKIAKPDTSEYYYLSFRQRLGFDRNISASYHGSISIHTYAGDGSASRTFLLNKLQDGGSFSDAANGLSFSQLSHTADYATVQVEIDGAPPPVCSPAAPTVTLTPATQSADAGTLLSYTLSLTNNDGASCAQSRFSLNRTQPADWAGNQSNTFLDLLPGETGTATFAISSPLDSLSGEYGISITVSDSAESTHDTTANASYSVLDTCTVTAPDLRIASETTSSDAGTALTYSLTVTNLDSAVCDVADFTIDASLPTGWSADFEPASLLLAPGQQGVASLQVISTTGATPGTHDIGVQVSEPGVAAHLAVIDTVYSVNEPTPVGDTQPPSAPAGLVGSANFKQVDLAWNPSSDNVGVTGYRVMRDGMTIAETTATGYTDTSSVGGVIHDYHVVAFDAAGNLSAASNTVTIGKSVKGKGGGDSTGGSGGGGKGGGKKK